MNSAKRFIPSLVWSLVCIFLIAADEAPHVPKVKLGVHTFTLPEGFEIEQVAGPPVVNRPICADFDEQGRLYVADSSGSNEKVQIQLEKRPHRIVRLEDTTGDGQFDKSVVFADRMMFPEGAMWHDGSLYVAAPPVIWKLTDTDDDGHADQREPWFDGKTLTGCANDLHGPYLGPDGWIYWCKGAFAKQTYERDGAPPWSTRAAHIFRRRPEGGPIEPVMTGGMDNPVEIVFTPGGERIFTTTFLQHPGDGRRDGLIHAVYGGVYGKVHGVLEGHPRTGPIMPVLSHLGAAAPCGLVRLEADGLGAEYRNNVLACSFNMHKLTRHVLRPSGGTFESRDTDFLVSENIDFHPTDVLEDADGSLLVVDTGGWYKLCCPTSNLSKPDILGAIYRIRHTGAQKVNDPRGRQLDWPAQTDQQLVQLLADERFAVRHRARQNLGKRGRQAVAALDRARASSNDREHRLEIVWALTQIDHLRARDAVRATLSDPDEAVRQAALHSVSVRRDRSAELALIEMLRSRSTHNRRAAAEGLGRIGSSSAVAPLLAAAGDTSDRVLEHSLIFALQEIADPGRTRLAVNQENPAIQRAALIALDQMPDGNLGVDDVRPLLTSDSQMLRETAWWIAEHHLEWAEGLAGYFSDEIRRTPAHSEALGQLSARLARFAGQAAIQDVMARAVVEDSLDPKTLIAVVNAMSESRLKTLPESWSRSLEDVFVNADTGVLEVVVKAVATLSGSKLNDEFVGRLQNVARDDQLPPRVRLQALVALPATERGQTDGDSFLSFVCDHLTVEQPIAIRALAVDLLVGTPLVDKQLVAVATALKGTGPMELKRLMEMFAKSHKEQVGLKLVDSLQQCSAATSLPVELLKKQLSGYGEDVLGRAESLFERIEQENRDKYRKLESILDLLAEGDIRRGQKVFHSTKAACIACHTLGYLGGRVGPDLSRIGQIRNERDLLESILFPSASFVRSYEPTTILTADGRVHSGVIRDETSSTISLQIDAQKLLHLAVDDVEERNPGTVSIMPTGLDKQLTPQQLADLVTFLTATK